MLKDLSCGNPDLATEDASPVSLAAKEAIPEFSGYSLAMTEH